MATSSAGNDRLELLQTFIRIVETGSLSAAAGRLGVSQPTVSRRLKALETMLDLRLMQRSTHNLKLTDDGERCFEHACHVCERWDSMAQALRGLAETPNGTLRVLVPHAFGQSQLLDLLETYLRDYPQVDIEWILDDRYPDFIAEGIDCAIRVGRVDEPGVVAIPLAEVSRIVVAAPRLIADIDVERVASLTELPWLALRTFYRDRVELSRAEDGETYDFSIVPRVSTDNLAVLRRLAISGFGAAIVSEWRVREDIEEGRLRHLASRWQAAPLPVFLVYPYSRFVSPRLRRFVDLVRDRTATLTGMRVR